MFLYCIFLLQVWNAPKFCADEPQQPYNEIDLLAGHENDVNYVQFRFVYWSCTLVENCLPLAETNLMKCCPLIAVVVLL